VKDKEEMLVRLIVAGSLERMLDYIMNISELTINLRNAVMDAEEDR
jgi:phosphate uptake regulator